MHREHDDIAIALAAPFREGEVRTRAQGGKQIPYITARVAMNRLDEVLGFTNWFDEYVPAENSVMCRLTLRLPDGRTITKADAGAYAGMPDAGDDDKSGYSDAFKRAAAKFGVGRQLYNDGMPKFIMEVYGEAADEAPRRPTSPPSQGKPAPTSGGNFTAPPSDVNGRGDGADPARHPNRDMRPAGAPKTGRALFAWTKEMEQKHEIGLLKYLNSWAKLQDFPGRMVDWDAEQVALAYAEATRKLQSIAQGSTEAYEEALSH